MPCFPVNVWPGGAVTEAADGSRYPDEIITLSDWKRSRVAVAGMLQSAASTGRIEAALNRWSKHHIAGTVLCSAFRTFISEYLGRTGTDECVKRHQAQCLFLVLPLWDTKKQNILKIEQRSFKSVCKHYQLLGRISYKIQDQEVNTDDTI